MTTTRTRCSLPALVLLHTILTISLLGSATAAHSPKPKPPSKSHSKPARKTSPQPTSTPTSPRKYPGVPPKAKPSPKPAPKGKAPHKPSPRTKSPHKHYTSSPPTYRTPSSPHPQPRGKPTCFPGNYNQCSDPRTANLLKAPGNNGPANNIPPTLLPNDGSVLVINEDQAYYLAGNYTQDFLSVAGVLYCGPPDGPQVDISLTVRALLVSGAFYCGTTSTPYSKNVTITLTGAGGVDGSKSIMVSGNVSWHGAPRATWTTITSFIDTGSNSFGTLDPVDWLPGERIVVSSTNYAPYNHSEVTVLSVAPSPSGGSIVTTVEPFNNTHWGDLQTFTSPSGKSWTLDERAQVGLLERNIVVQGDPATSGDDTRIGGQMTISLGGNAWIRNVRFYLMGEQGRLGSYPVHYHLLGDRSGNFITGSVIHKSWNRCVTIHSTDNVRVERNICFDHVGHGFFMEDGCETGNKFMYNLGMATYFPPAEASTIDTDRSHLATFWITNPFNHYIGNVAAGSGFAGFWMVTPTKPINKCQQGDQKPDLLPESMSLGANRDNIAHSNMVAFGIERGICNGDRSSICNGAYKPPTAASVPDTVSNFTSFKNGHPVRTLWITVDNRINFRDCKFSGGAGTLFSGKQVLTNCLFVGESANNRSDNIGGVVGRIHWGFGLYDGPAGLVDTYFTNFFTPPGQKNGTSACMAPVGSAFKHWPMFLRNVEFADHVPTATRLYMQRGNYSMGEFTSQAVIDDGSLAGLGPKLLVPWVNDTASNIPFGGLCTSEFNVGADCEYNSTWSVYICPPTQKMGSIRLRHSYPLDTKTSHVVDITRSDGQALTTDNNIGNRPWIQFNAVLGQGFSYTVSYLRDPTSLMYNADGTPSNFQVSLLNVDVGDSVSVTLKDLPTTNPAWRWRVWDCAKKVLMVPATTSSQVTIQLTGYSNNQGGALPNLKGADHHVWVCPGDCRPC